jgi:hypothetical protein
VELSSRIFERTSQGSFSPVFLDFDLPDFLHYSAQVTFVSGA